MAVFRWRHFAGEIIRGRFAGTAATASAIASLNLRLIRSSVFGLTLESRLQVVSKTFLIDTQPYCMLLVSKPPFLRSMSGCDGKHGLPRLFHTSERLFLICSRIG